jgi:NAD(P)-dependent dehydrogenase (short-subunit alcohol dehydrogenase family)
MPTIGAPLFLEEGAYVLGLDLNGDALKRVREENRQYSDHLQTLVADISRKEQVAAAVSEATKDHEHLVNTASAAGVRGTGGGVAYTASKHGVLGLTKRMSFELGPQGIRVVAIGPGTISTQMNAGTSKVVDDRLRARRNGAVSEVADLTLVPGQRQGCLHSGRSRDDRRRVHDPLAVLSSKVIHCAALGKRVHGG